MKTFQEWLAERGRRQCEGLWFNDKRAEPGMSNVNPLEQEKGKKGKKRKQTVLPTAKAVKPALPAMMKRRSTR